MENISFDDVQLHWTGKGEPRPVTFSCQDIQIVHPHASHLDIHTIANPANHLLLGQDHQVLSWLLDNGFQGCFDCIYIDPPYLSDTVYHSQMKIVTDTDVYRLKQPIFRDSGYQNNSEYLQHLYVTISMVKQLLSMQGNLFVHLDWHSSHYVKIILDEVFSRQRFINEIIWCYGGGSGTRRHFHRKHDVILWYSRGKDYIFNPQYRPYTPGTLQRGLTQVKGDRYQLDARGAMLQDWWTDIPKVLSPTARNNWKYPTQKPVELLQRIISASTEKNSLVGDFYAGSGTTSEACEALGRNWVLGDNHLFSIQTTMHRLIKVNSRSFKLSALIDYPPNTGKLQVKSAIKKAGSAEELLIELDSYKPDDSRAAGLHWLDYWELGFIKQDIFVSLVQVLPAKRGQPVPAKLTVQLNNSTGLKMAVQAWDILGKRAWAEI